MARRSFHKTLLARLRPANCLEVDTAAIDFSRSCAGDSYVALLPPAVSGSGAREDVGTVLWPGWIGILAKLHLVRDVCASRQTLVEHLGRRMHEIDVISWMRADSRCVSEGGKRFPRSIGTIR